MVISTRIYVEHPDLALTHVIRALPEANIRVVSDAGTDPKHETHFFWIQAPDFGAVEELLAEDHTVSEFWVVTETVDGFIYGIEYSDDVTLLSPATIEAGGLTLESRSQRNGWELRLQLEDYASLSAIRDHIERNELRFDVLEIKQIEDGELEPDVGLTEPQVEALVCAYRHGYYDEPRQISLEGLASILDISPTAVSGRLRRGAATLTEATLAEDDRH